MVTQSLYYTPMSRADGVTVQSEEEWDVAGAVAELPQLSDSDEEEGDEGDRYYFITSRPAPGGDIYHASRVGDVERVTCGYLSPSSTSVLLQSWVLTVRGEDMPLTLLFVAAFAVHVLSLTHVSSLEVQCRP